MKQTLLDIAEAATFVMQQEEKESILVDFEPTASGWMCVHCGEHLNGFWNMNYHKCKDIKR